MSSFGLREEKYVAVSYLLCCTGKSLSEALIFASTNPQYDDRLLIELQVQYIKIPTSNLGRTCCVQKLFPTFRIFFVYNMFSSCSAKRRASDKDLPVPINLQKKLDKNSPRHRLLSCYQLA